LSSEYPKLMPYPRSGCCKFVVRQRSRTTMDETKVGELLVAELTRSNQLIVKVAPHQTLTILSTTIIIHSQSFQEN
jgi:hypothetical protein